MKNDIINCRSSEGRSWYDQKYIVKTIFSHIFCPIQHNSGQFLELCVYIAIIFSLSTAPPCQDYHWGMQLSEISGVTFDLLEKLRCFTDVDLTSTSAKHTVRNFEYRTDQKQSIGACMFPTKLDKLDISFLPWNGK